MSRLHRRVIRKAALGIFLLALLAWLVPSFLSAERYRRRLEAGLERVLRRPVAFGAVSLRLLPRPGFSVENVVVGEDPAFGSEPFARVERIECDVGWRSLWQSRIDLGRLRLVRPSLNMVRNAQGMWNVGRLLLTSGMMSPAAPSSAEVASPGVLTLEADEGRLNFKVGAAKKPFAITNLRARLTFDPSRGRVGFRLEGSPVRADQSLPTPGPLELSGDWVPGEDLNGPLSATLQTRGALLYNWVPLLTGKNPEIYGVVDAEYRLTGPPQALRFEGQTRISQLHRWELPPPSGPTPVTVRFRGQFERAQGRALVESLDITFAESHLHLSGSIEKVSRDPELDVVVALEHSRLEDLLELCRRFWGRGGDWSLSGRADGLVTVQGQWSEPRYGGFLSARGLRLITRSGTFPVSEAAVRIDRRGARLEPVRLSLAPRVELVAEGILRRPGANGRRRSKPDSPRYELNLSAKSVPLRDLVRLGRALGLSRLDGVGFEGVGGGTFRLSGDVWPFTSPTVAGRFELRAARLFAPGLTEPVNLPRAVVEWRGDRVFVDPLVAVIGTSVFTGKLERGGEPGQPWRFDLRANALRLEQGALWFDVLGHRPPLPLLDRIPGLSSLGGRRVAASELFGLVNAKGRFETPALSYRSLTLDDFKSSVEISGRVIRAEAASFHAGGGRGHATAEVDLTRRPAVLRGEATLAAARLQSIAPYLPPALRKVRGSASGTGQFETRGLSRSEMSAALTAEASVRLGDVALGDFDPLRAIARQAEWGTMAPARGQVVLRSAELTLEVRDRRVLLSDCSVELDGAGLKLAGQYAFDGTLDLGVHADFRQITRRWLSAPGASSIQDRVADFRLSGPFDRLTVVPEVQLTQAAR